MENNYLNNTNEQKEEQGFDLTLFLLECLSQWKWFVLSLVVVLGFSMFHILRQVPQYKVDSLVLIIDKWSKSQSDVLTQSLGIASGADNVITEMAVMRSITITQKIVNDLNLYTSYSYKGKLRNTPLYNNTPIVVVPDSTTNVNMLNTAINLTIERPTESNTYNIKGRYNVDNGVIEEKEIELTEVTLPYTLYLPTVGTFTIGRAHV